MMTNSSISGGLVIKPKLPPKSPNGMVAETMLVFFRAVFDENYQSGNWYLNPKAEMFIREDFPSDVKEDGFRPGITIGEPGMIQRAIDNIGMFNYVPQNPNITNIFIGHDEVYQGMINIKTISKSEEEAERLAYLCHLSINEFTDMLLGVNGIGHIYSPGYTPPQPYEASSEYESFACEVQISYVIRVPYLRTRLDGTRLETINVEIQE